MALQSACDRKAAYQVRNVSRIALSDFQTALRTLSERFEFARLQQYHIILKLEWAQWYLGMYSKLLQNTGWDLGDMPSTLHCGAFSSHACDLDHTTPFKHIHIAEGVI